MPQNPRPSRTHHRPVTFSTEVFDRYPGGSDPQTTAQAAHFSAHALLQQGRKNTDPNITQKLVHFTDTFGLETLAEMWSQAPALSLPGALWRIYLIRDTVHTHTTQIAHYYARGMEQNWRSSLIAGVADPPTEQEVAETTNTILTGAYTGDFDIALERFAAFCAVIATGQRATAHTIVSGKNYPMRSSEPTLQPELHPSAEVQTEARRRAERLHCKTQQLLTISQELEQAAQSWRAGTLE
ncbi:histone acetyltransferase [Rothia sp. P7181]|uniref:histone acetyltransferase n=1 Tax=Rothia sp. P7181 TaxID=3402663 RepID=UPI003AE34B33